MPLGKVDLLIFPPHWIDFIDLFYYYCGRSSFIIVVSTVFFFSFFFVTRISYWRLFRSEKACQWYFSVLGFVPVVRRKFTYKNKFLRWVLRRTRRNELFLRRVLRRAWSSENSQYVGFRRRTRLRSLTFCIGSCCDMLTHYHNISRVTWELIG